MGLTATGFWRACRRDSFSRSGAHRFQRERREGQVDCATRAPGKTWTVRASDELRSFCASSFALSKGLGLTVGMHTRSAPGLHARDGRGARRPPLYPARGVAVPRLRRRSLQRLLNLAGHRQRGRRASCACESRSVRLPVVLTAAHGLTGLNRDAGLLQDYHLVLKPQRSELGRQRTSRRFGLGKPGTWAFIGVPQVRARPRDGQARTVEELTVKSEHYHLVTADSAKPPAPLVGVERADLRQHHVQTLRSPFLASPHRRHQATTSSATPSPSSPRRSSCTRPPPRP